MLPPLAVANFCYIRPGEVQVIVRDPVTGKFPCPCGSPRHARYLSSKLHQLCGAKPHPPPEANVYPDPDPDDVAPVPHHDGNVTLRECSRGSLRLSAHL